ncbi:MAG: Coproporphyrinogen dehydrogenase [Bacteroidota bacterium]|jgi:oxygen-independent coproporphyrinogen-3 oxidase
MEVPIHLLQKYDVPVPRYTSYPTVLNWDKDINEDKWKTFFINRFNDYNEKEGISIYIHLPFCEKLCTFCGCNRKISNTHDVEEEYVEVLLKEWRLYRQLMPQKPVLKELHIGGGTPTFFSPSNLKRIFEHIFKEATIPDNHEFSFEGHPNNTTYEHLNQLFELGFNRVSFGMQDSNVEIQKVINRIQPQENVEKVVKWAREIGYDSVNLDLVYGLPLQTIDRMQKTIQDALKIKPDRIAFYSYAHVPWTSKVQRLFDENDLPKAEEKILLYQLGRKLFTQNGYQDIGMDHFALPNDLMVRTRNAGKLHRNFMGYTVQQTGLLIGLGVSSISDIYDAFAQNEKTINDYYARVYAGKLPIFKGYFLSTTDKAMRKYILNIACHGKTIFQKEDLETLEAFVFPELEKLAADQLILWSKNGLEVTALGLHFLRNICRPFDLKSTELRENKNTFSKAI